MVIADIAADGAHVFVRSAWRHKELIKAVPGARWSRDDGLWMVPLSWTSCLALRATFKTELEIGPALDAWARAYVTDVITPAMSLRDALTAAGDPDLFAHQRADVQFLATARRSLLANEQGVGKGLTLDTPVLTPYGWRRADEIVVGDALIGRDGQATKVTGVYPQPIQPTYRVTFSDGVSVVTDASHLWAVQRPLRKLRGDTSFVVRSTGEMLEEGVRDGSGNARWHVPTLTAPVEYAPVGDLPVDPYLLGVVLGDGSWTWHSERASLDTWRLSTDLDILIAVGATNVHAEPGCWGGATYMPPLGLTGKKSHEKFIPEPYLRASASDRLALLQGLLDTDGSPMRNGGVEFSSTSKDLADGVSDLARSLGGMVRYRPEGRVTSYTHAGERRQGRRSWRVNVKLPPEMQPFRLQRKLDKWVAPTKYKVTRSIKSIERAGNAATVCFTVDADDSLFVVDNFVVTHNTASSIRTLTELTRRGENVFPALVVCPNSVKVNWAREFDRWWPGIKTVVVSGTAVQRRKLLTLPAHAYVINYESLKSHSRLAPYGSVALRRCVECGGEDARVTVTRCDVHERELNRINFRTVIADELHRAKDPSARQTRALKWVARGAEFRFGLTGTPVANNVIDLWSLLNFIDPVEWPSKTRWVERMVNVTYNVFGGVVVSGIKPEMQEEFERTVYPRMRRMTKAVVLPFLPPIVSERRDVPMTPKQKKAYDQMAEHMIAMLDDEDMLVTTNPMIQAMRLLQLASSYGELEVIEKVNEHGDIETRDRLVLSDPSSKIDAFLDDLPDYEGRSVIVFAVSRQLIMLLSKHLAKKDVPHGLIVGNQDAVDRQEAIDDFQAGRKKMILATVQAGGTGITLTAADTVVYLQRSWSLIDMEQSLARYHRVGSERHESLLRVDYVAPDTFEEAVIARLEGKGETLENIVRDKDLLRKAIGGMVPSGD